MNSRPRQPPASAVRRNRKLQVRKARNTPDKETGRSLATLPCEVRMRILANLLTSESPLRKRVNSGIDPTILRTCKTFAEDHRRTPLLYMNTFVVELQIDHDDSEIWFFGYGLPTQIGGHQPDLSSIPKMLFRQVQNLVVEINVDYGPILSQTRVIPLDHRGSVADLVIPLKRFKALQTLQIHVNNKHYLPEYDLFGNDMLDSLRELRGLKSVTILGTTPEYATQLKATMESCDPSDNLQAMGNALRRYLGPEFYDDDDWDEIDDALVAYDVELFCTVRGRIIKRTEAARAALLRQVYKHD